MIAKEAVNSGFFVLTQDLDEDNNHKVSAKTKQ
jgi:hypothetical protein